MDAANVDLKAFTEDFYRTVCGGHLDGVLDTLVYLKRDTSVWFEITTLLIPGENDSDDEIDALSGWVASALGPDVPLHFTAFHPDWKMRDKPATSVAILSRARDIARANGVRYVYTGNVHDRAGGSADRFRCAGSDDPIGSNVYLSTRSQGATPLPLARSAAQGNGGCLMRYRRVSPSGRSTANQRRSRGPSNKESKSRPKERAENIPP